MGTEDQSEAKRTTLGQHLLFLLPIPLLVSALIVTTPDILKIFVGRSMAIRSGSNLSKLKGKTRKLLRLLSQIPLPLLLLM